jgi:hypothetical protein
MRQGPAFGFLRLGERDAAKRDMCSKPLTAKSRFRAEEAQRDGTLILLESSSTYPEKSLGRTHK